MKFIVVCDKKPDTCEKCAFWNEGFRQTGDNIFDLCKSCYLGQDHDTCPLTEVNTIWEDF